MMRCVAIGDGVMDEEALRHLDQGLAPNIINYL